MLDVIREWWPAAVAGIAGVVRWSVTSSDATDLGAPAEFGLAGVTAWNLWQIRKASK